MSKGRERPLPRLIQPSDRWRHRQMLRWLLGHSVRPKRTHRYTGPPGDQVVKHAGIARRRRLAAAAGGRARSRRRRSLRC